MTDHRPPTTAHYQQPGWFTQHVFNRFVAWLTRRGVSVWGSRVLEVPGRRTGEPRRVPVNLLTLDGVDYLVSPRGHGQWVRNVRANDGRLDLLLGRRRTHHVAHELADADKVDVLRAYLAPLEVRGRSVLRRRRRRQLRRGAARHRARTTRCSASMLPVEPTARPPGTPRSARAREIIDAAFAILDDEGADALTMRRLADDLGMRAPSLYKHVPDKAAPRGGAHRGHLLRRRRRPPRRARRPGPTRAWCAACSTAYRTHSLGAAEPLPAGHERPPPPRPAPGVPRGVGRSAVLLRRRRPVPQPGPVELRPRHGDPRDRRSLPRRQRPRPHLAGGRGRLCGVTAVSPMPVPSITHSDRTPGPATGCPPREGPDHLVEGDPRHGPGSPSGAVSALCVTFRGVSRPPRP